jgi:WD40 repeat protein
MHGFLLWDAESGALLGRVPTPRSVPFGLCAALDGKRLAWGGEDGVTVTGVSSPAAPDGLWRWKGGNWVQFTPDGRFFVSSPANGPPTELRDALTGNVVRTLAEPTRYTTSFMLSRDGSAVVTSTERRNSERRNRNKYEPPEPRLEVWDVVTGQLRKVVAQQRERLTLWRTIAISADGTTVAFTTNEQLTVVDVASGSLLWQIQNPKKYHSWSFLDFSPSGDMLLGTRTDYEAVPTTTIDLFDARTGLTLNRLNCGSFDSTRAAFSPNGRQIITFGQNVPVRVWDAATGELLPAYDGHRVAPQMLALNDNGGTIISGDHSYSICMWSGPALRHRFDVMHSKSLGLSGDGRTAIVTSRDRVTHLLDLAENTQRVLKRNGSECSAISLDGRWAAVGGFNGIELIEVAGGEVRRTLTGHTGEPYALAFSADGRRILSVARTRKQDHKILLERVSGKYPPPPIPDNTIRIWDTTTGKELRKWDIAPRCATLSPHGKMVLAGCADGRIRRMKVDTDEELEPLPMHSGAVIAVAVSADRRWVASAGADGIVLWDPTTGRELRRLAHDHGTPTAIAFSGDGRRLASAGSDGTILIWEVASIE